MVQFWDRKTNTEKEKNTKIFGDFCLSFGIYFVGKS